MSDCRSSSCPTALLEILRISLRVWAPVLGAKRRAAAAPMAAPVMNKPVNCFPENPRILHLQEWSKQHITGANVCENFTHHEKAGNHSSAGGRPGGRGHVWITAKRAGSFEKFSV